MVAEATEAPPGAAGLTFLPCLLGERAPVWDPTARAVFFVLGRNHGRPDMIRAIFEGVGFSVLDIADRLDGMGIPIRQVSASGSRAARADQPDQGGHAGCAVTLTRELETSALGAALVAGVTAGVLTTIEEALYRELYERLAPTFATRETLIARHSEVLPTVLARSENL